MTSLLIKDLSLAHPLDREAASAVRGGIAYIEIEPGGGTGGAAPGDCMPYPWPMPAMPALPPGFSPLPGPGWCGTTTEPQGPREPFDRARLQ
jgi:hypothetical protein